MTEKHNMRIRSIFTAALLLAVLFLAGTVFQVRADEVTEASDAGESPEVYIENINITGKSEEEVQAVIDAKLESYRNDQISLYIDTNTISVTAGELGLYNADANLAHRAANMQISGNVLCRYKMDKYMNDNGPIFYQLDLRVDEEAVRAMVNERCAAFNNDPVNMIVERDPYSGEINVTPKHDGYYVDVETTTADLCQYLNNNWHGGYGAAYVTINWAEAKGNIEDTALMTDVIGSGSTSFDTSESQNDRNNNLRNATEMINGTVIYPGEEFSVISAITPFTEENGYLEAGAQENGRLIQELAGGVCQVSTTLYQAVLGAELEVTERYEHSMIVSYVDPSKDAAISEGVKDLKFVNSTDAPIYISGFLTDNTINFQIIGHETRDPARSISYESETTNNIEITVRFELDSSMPFGTIEASGGHEGMDAVLYKLVKMNGEVVSREIVNTSNYEMSPETYIIGTENIHPAILAQLESAIASNADAGTVCGIVDSANAGVKFVDYSGDVMYDTTNQNAAQTEGQ